MELPNWIWGSYESQAYTADQEDTFNLYPERMESPGATSKWALYPTPGVTLLSSTGAGAGRAHFAMAGREFAVFGPVFMEIAQFGLQTVRGAVAIGSNPATISSNGDGGGELLITSGDNGYNYDLGTNVGTQIAALNGLATMGAQSDGYMLVLDANTSTFYISDLFDNTTWDPTQFAQRSLAPDPWKALAVNGRDIWLLGEQTSEVWYNTGASPFPFAPNTSAGLIPYGIVAPFSAKTADGTLIWLGRSASSKATVLQAAGFQPQVIASFPLQAALDGYESVEDAIADVYTENGHTFYLISFPIESVTWAYDLQTGQWSKRGTWMAERGVYVAWRPRWHALAFGEHRMLDSTIASVYRMSTSTSTDVDGRYIRRYRRGPALMQENQRVKYSWFELDLEPGLGAVTGQGSDPQVMLRFSDDGGKTWSAERWMSAGAVGEYFRRVRWERLGVARRRAFEVVFAEPVPWRLTNAYIDARPLGLAARQAPA